jgi:CPA1 family monovalent cation:H+ antiporter
MENTFLLSTLSFLFLMLISSFVYLLGRKIKINYTILLVIVGLLLVPISKIEFFSFINDFKLTPDILFFIFLPVLLFEAAYNINYKDLLKNSKSIFSLAI